MSGHIEPARRRFRRLREVSTVDRAASGSDGRAALRIVAMTRREAILRLGSASSPRGLKRSSRRPRTRVIGRCPIALRTTMDRVARRLAARPNFIRVRRSAIVNVRAIAALERYGKSSFVVHLRSGAKVISSRYSSLHFAACCARTGNEPHSPAIVSTLPERPSIWLGERSRIRSWRHRRCCRDLSISPSVDRDTEDAYETSHRC
jgi:hypothetical protein